MCCTGVTSCGPTVKIMILGVRNKKSNLRSDIIASDYNKSFQCLLCARNLLGNVGMCLERAATCWMKVFSWLRIIKIQVPAQVVWQSEVFCEKRSIKEVLSRDEHVQGQERQAEIAPYSCCCLLSSCPSNDLYIRAVSWEEMLSSSVDLSLHVDCISKLATSFQRSPY